MLWSRLSIPCEFSCFNPWNSLIVSLFLYFSPTFVQLLNAVIIIMTPGMRSQGTNESKPSISSSDEGQVLKSPPRSANGFNLGQIAEAELQELHSEAASGDPTSTGHVRFPAACQAMLLALEGNSRCLDCGASNPEWAAVSYGAMVCLQCAGTHRSLGVNVSTVRSVTMDHWRYDEVVKMMEGGNRQLSAFFQRHALGRECS
jgi:hypothetical protein